MQEEEILTANEAAKFLKTSRRTLLKLIYLKEIKAYKFGKQWRLIKSDLISYVKKGIHK